MPTDRVAKIVRGYGQTVGLEAHPKGACARNPVFFLLKISALSQLYLAPDVYWEERTVIDAHKNGLGVMKIEGRGRDSSPFWPQYRSPGEGSNRRDH